MNDTKHAIPQLALLLVWTASQAACVDSIEAFPNYDGAGDASSQQVDAGDSQEAPVLPAEPPMLDAGTCTLRPGGRELSSCRRAYQSCAINGPAFAEATFIGCTDERGIGGNPEISVDTCEQALSGESGQTCSAVLRCTEAASDTCCVRHAECEEDAPLLLAEICVPSCERTQLLSGPTMRSCDDVAAAEAEPESAYGSQSKLPNLVGLPCVGEFECGPQSSYGFSVFCGAGRLQLLTLGPSGLRSP